MKNYFLILWALALTSLALHAGPVDQETAQRLGQSFVTAKFEQSAELSLVQTAFSERGEACYYIYNVGNTGFVILSADDHYHPIIGYSEEGNFDINDMAPALADYLEGVRRGVMEASRSSVVKPSVAADWAMLEKTGRMVSRHGGREDEYLVETKWNQNSPYNYYCPEAEGGPGGRCYAGCVATAGAQLMRYWNHPSHGQGSHTYYPEEHPEYGPLTANFGEATYDWENMPNSISGSSPQEQIEAVAQLIYHVGVSVDMNYTTTGSGAVTGRLCQTMPDYFFYTDQMANLYREDYTHEEYMQMIITSIDMDWPMVQRGGGHAYVLDGYNDNDMVHYNWGWSGSSDGWFNVDEHGYTDGESILFNYVPAEVYAATSAEPTNINVVPSVDNSLTATVSWTNPTVTLTGAALSAIEQIVVERNGQVVYTEDNVAPGAEMSIVDETVPYFDAFSYTVYAIIDGHRGASAKAENVYVGPCCDWRIIMQSNSIQGWKGGSVSLYSGTGKKLIDFTMTSSTTETVDFAVPAGRVSFGWNTPHGYVSNIAIIIKDAENNTVYSYTGNSSGMTPGIFLETNNSCGNVDTEAPYNLFTESGDESVVLQWEFDGPGPEYGFNIYRDEQIYVMVNDPTARSFVDDDFVTGHCYMVTALGLGGESEASNEYCASAGDCMNASNMDFEYVGDDYKIKLKWDRPAVSEGLSGYYLFRKQGEDGTYVRIKLLGASVTTFTDHNTHEEDYYYYRLYAYYRAIDCTSAPATAKDDPTKFYLKVYYSPLDVEEAETIAVKVFPNPADQSLKVEAEGMTRVTVYNLLGQLTYDVACEGNALNVNVSGWSEGMYLIKVQTAEGLLTRRLNIIH